MLAKRLERESLPPSDHERRFVLHDIPWWMYVALRDALDHRGSLKMTYLEGDLELMTPSTLHEDAKTIIARLIEAWAMERNVDLRGFGGATFRREAKQSTPVSACQRSGCGSTRAARWPCGAWSVIGTRRVPRARSSPTSTSRCCRAS